MDSAEAKLAIDMGTHAAHEALLRTKSVVDNIGDGNHVKGAAYMVCLAVIRATIDAFLAGNPQMMDETMKAAWEEVYAKTFEYELKKIAERNGSN